MDSLQRKLIIIGGYLSILSISAVSARGACVQYFDSADASLCLNWRSETLGRHSSTLSDPESLSGFILIQIAPR